MTLEFRVTKWVMFATTFLGMWYADIVQGFGLIENAIFFIEVQATVIVAYSGIFFVLNKFSMIKKLREENSVLRARNIELEYLHEHVNLVVLGENADLKGENQQLVRANMHLSGTVNRLGRKLLEEQTGESLERELQAFEQGPRLVK